MKKPVAICAILLICGCIDSNPSSKKIHVSASLFPIYDIARNIAGDRVELSYIIPVGANPHTYKPVPSVLDRIRNARLVITVDEHLDGWIHDFVPSNTVFAVLNRIENNQHHSGINHAEQSDPERNPHVWLSIRKAISLSETIERLLSNLDPEHARIYSNNSDVYKKRLEALDAEISRLFSGLNSQAFFQWHPAWDYFARDYGLEIAGTVESGHGDEPSVKEFKNLVDIAKLKNISLIVVGLGTESKAAESLAREVDGRILRLDSIGDPGNSARDTYLKLMRDNAVKLADSMKAKQDE